MRVSNTSSIWLSNRRVVAKRGEKSYSRCTSRRGRNSALKIIRIGFENPVAVYSICGVNPRKPQSHVGPRRVLELRENTTHSPSGIGKRQTHINTIPSVEIVPDFSVSDVSTRPLAKLS